MMQTARMLGLSLVAALLAFAGWAESVINGGEDGLAVRGYDTVAYFTEGRPVVGSPNHEIELHGVRWRFSAAKNLELFRDDPEAYMPRYGGFCSGAMSRGVKATVDPEAFAIIDGKLYLAFHRRGIEEFTANADESVGKADENWKTLGKTH